MSDRRKVFFVNWPAIGPALAVVDAVQHAEGGWELETKPLLYARNLLASGAPPQRFAHVRYVRRCAPPPSTRQPIHTHTSSSNMKPRYVRRGCGELETPGRKPTFPVRFSSFMCSQPRHVGSIFDEDGSEMPWGAVLRSVSLPLLAASHYSRCAFPALNTF